MSVSYDTLLAIHTACAAWELTGGRFDPTVHDSLLRLGYDETIDLVRSRDRSNDRGIGAAARAPGASGSFPSPGCADIITDPTTLTVRMPAAVRIDLGGIGKGLAADLVAIGLVDRGAAGALVNIGGDVRAIGTPADGHAWHVAVEDPRTDRILSVIDLLDGGLATSTTLRRRWQSAGAGVHHLVSPATGHSTSSGVVGVTVAAGTAAWADALSKVPFVDPDHHDSFIVASALVMYADGSMSQRGPCDLSRPVPA
jgi:thiamine biosynthesis lipoprotein